MRSRDAMSMAEAAAALGVSVPTVRQMVARGQLVAFRTPGGHLRFTADSVRAAKGQPVSESGRQSLPNPLQSRRERVEELNLEAQEFRAERQLDALRREQEEEEADRRVEEEALRQERNDQARALVLDRQRTKRAEAEERHRRRAEEEAQAQREHFVSSWLEVALAIIPWGVPADVRLDVVSKVEDFLQECQLTKESQIRRVLADIVADALAPWQREKAIAAIIEDARKLLPFMARGLSWSPTEWDLKAKQAAFNAIANLKDNSAGLEQIRTAARVAVRTIVEEYESHQRAANTAKQKAQFLDHWFLFLQLSEYVRQLLDGEAVEFEPGETIQDVVSSLEIDARKYLDQHLTGTETREEVLKLLREFVRAEFKL
jgi:excisionase family DNA binding protein